MNNIKHSESVKEIFGDMNITNTLRSIEDHQEYELHKRITKELFGSMEEYVNKLVFDSKYNGYAITSNRFPYMYLKNHKVFWVQQGYEEFYDDQRLEDIMFNKRDKRSYFKSAYDRRSIFTILHYHFH
jgi:alpha-N-acetylglucosamine transferase